MQCDQVCLALIFAKWYLCLTARPIHEYDMMGIDIKYLGVENQEFKLEFKR